jgi:hypothetical protein
MLVKGICIFRMSRNRKIAALIHFHCGRLKFKDRKGNFVKWTAQANHLLIP